MEHNSVEEYVNKINEHGIDDGYSQLRNWNEECILNNIRMRKVYLSKKYFRVVD